jgi:hypothetical protein
VGLGDGLGKDLLFAGIWVHEAGRGGR